MCRPREALDGAQQQTIRRKENAEPRNCNHNEHHERLLCNRCRNAFLVDTHGLGNRHGAANVANFHAFFRVAILIDFPGRIAVALETRLGHIKRLGIAEYALACFFINPNAAIRSEVRIGAERVEGLLLEGVGRIRFLPRSFSRKADNVIGVAREQRAYRFRRHYAYQRFRAEVAVFISIDDVLVHVDEVPHGTHL